MQDPTHGPGAFGSPYSIGARWKEHRDRDQRLPEMPELVNRHALSPAHGEIPLKSFRYWCDTS